MRLVALLEGLSQVWVQAKYPWQCTGGTARGKRLRVALACRMGQLFQPKARDYVHRAIVQAIADAKAEAAPCKQPPREELPQDLVEMLTGYKQVRDPSRRNAHPHYKQVYPVFTVEHSPATSRGLRVLTVEQPRATSR